MNTKYVTGALLLTLLLTLLLSGCGMGGAEETPEDSASEEEFTVTVAVQRMQPQVFSDYFEAAGEIQPESSVDVFAETVGELSELSVEKGDRVTRDQVIAQVDPSRPGQRFSASPVRAPISGTIVGVTTRIGAQVAQQTPVARIATTDQLELIAGVPERYVRFLEPGGAAEVRLDSLPGEVFAARIDRLSPVVDPQSRTLETVLAFRGATDGIRPGMFARVRIQLESREDALVVPQRAVIRRDSGAYVYVIDSEDRARSRDVELGIEIDAMAELRSGIEPGDRVIVKGQNLLEDGTRVRVVEES